MNENDFTSWVHNRRYDFHEMYGDYDRAERVLYEAIVKLSPEYMNEKQLPFITTTELKSVFERIMSEEMKHRSSFRHRESHYPFIDRCPQQLNTVTDKFIEIILRGLIV